MIIEISQGAEWNFQPPQSPIGGPNKKMPSPTRRLGTRLRVLRGAPRGKSALKDNVVG